MLFPPVSFFNNTLTVQFCFIMNNVVYLCSKINDMTKLEIIQETVEFYKNNPRSINGDEGWQKCVYLSESGNKCAFSRCCTDEGVTWLHEQIDIAQKGGTVLPNYLQHLKPEYQGHDATFWRYIQRIHDEKENWDGQILTEIGIKFINTLKEEYGSDIEN